MSRYVAPGADATLRIEGCADSKLWVELHEPSQTGAFASAAVEAGQRSLRRLFPDLDLLARSGVIRAQLVSESGSIGAPLIIERLCPRPAARSAWEARALRAIESGDEGVIEALRAMPSAARERLRGKIELEPELEPGAEPATCAIRIYDDARLVFRVERGEIAIRLHPESAPRTAHHVRSLVDGGLYSGTRARLLRDPAGEPALLVLGDLSEDGLGACGWTVDFERSTMIPSRGVVWIGRRTDDPNSGSSQLLIALSDDAASALAEDYCAVGKMVEGASVIERMASDRGEFFEVVSATLEPAPPIDLEPAPELFSVEPDLPGER